MSCVIAGSVRATPSPATPLDSSDSSVTVVLLSPEMKLYKRLRSLSAQEVAETKEYVSM